MWSAFGDQFVDLPSLAQVVRVFIRLLLAVVLGAVLGYERERHASSAGLRTHMMVALGAAMFVVVPEQAGFDPDAMSRVLQGLIAGIGFLGAGTIMKLDVKEQIKGLTTAGSVWATASIGIACGLGKGVTAGICTLFALLILAVMPRFERKN